MKAPSLLGVAAVMVTALCMVPERADAQVRTARPRAVVVRPPIVRSHVAFRPAATVFIGGFHFPSLYRTSLYYGPRYGYSGGYYGYYGAPYYQWPGGFGYGYDASGSVRLQVQPREAEVFIDGYYAGTVDDFDGVFQRLHIEPGDHDVLVYLPGHRPFEQRVYLQPGKTFSIRHTMEPLAPGEPEPARPAGAPAASPRDPRVSAPGPGPRPPGPAPGAPDARGSNAVRDFGQLSLRVQPADAEVVIDGERWEAAPENERLVVQLGAGMHRLEIRKEGYRSYFTDVTLHGGETRTLNVALTRQ